MESRMLNFNDSNLVSKANTIIEASYKLGVLEQKIISVIASNINPADKDFQTYTFSIKEFKELIGSKSKSIYTDIDKIATKLMQPFMFINAEGKPTRIAWLSKATYNTNEGTITVRFDPDLKPFFLFLNEKFTRYKLGNIINLRSNYSIRMYELLKSYEGLTERTFTLQDLRQKLGLGDKYPKWINFRQRVLDHAQQEMAEKTDIRFTYEIIKKGRSVHKVKFKILSNSKLLVQLTDDIQQKMEKVLENDDSILIENLAKELNISKKVIQEWFEKHGKEIVLESIESIRYNTDIKNPIAYISTILKNKKNERTKETMDPIEEAIRKVKMEFTTKVKKSKIEPITNFIVRDTALSIFEEFMPKDAAKNLWSEQGKNITNEINEHNQKMLY